MIRPVRVSAPTVNPVVLADVREHLRVTDNAEDYLIDGYVSAATAYLDGYSGILGRCLVDQVWRQDFESFACLRLPFPDCKNIAIVWRDAAGTATTVSPTDYWLESTSTGANVVFKSAWISPSLPTGVAAPVSVTFTAGYGGAAEVPAGLRMAILLMVGHWYNNREAVVDGPSTALALGFDALVSPHRIWAAA